MRYMHINFYKKQSDMLPEFQCTLLLQINRKNFYYNMFVDFFYVFSTTTQEIRLRRRVDVDVFLRRRPLPLISVNDLMKRVSKLQNSSHEFQQYHNCVCIFVSVRQNITGKHCACVRLYQPTVEVIAVLLHAYRLERPSVMTLRMCPSLLLNIVLFSVSKRKYRYRSK